METIRPRRLLWTRHQAHSEFATVTGKHRPTSGWSGKTLDNDHWIHL